MLEKNNPSIKKQAAQSEDIILKIDISAIEKVFDSKNIGSIYIENMLNQNFLKELRRDVTTLQKGNRFTTAKSKENDAQTQNFSHFYIEPGEHSASELDKLPAIRKLARAYTDHIYNPIANVTKGFLPVEMINSITINSYPSQGGHISYHQDYGYNRNIITAISIEGVAKSSVALSEKGEMEQSFIVKPGSLHLMRAPFDSMGEDGPLLWRPWHKTETLNVQRYSLLLRNISEELKRVHANRSNPSPY